MSKIKLSIENLTVESFATCAGEGEHGTVFGNAKTIDFCYTADGQASGCDAPECGTAYPACPSANDGCASSPHSMTLPCNGCVETDHFCVIDGGELG
jgi:hypothetical protein